MKTLSVSKSAWLIGLMVLALAQSACNYATQLIGGAPALQSGTPAPASCANKYTSAKNGATRIFVGASGYTEQATLSNLDTSSFDVDWQTNPVNGQKASFSDQWVCTTAGLVMVGSSHQKFSSETGVTVPASIKAGDHWTQYFETVVTTFTDNYTAIGEESVTVPAGTFTAMKIQFSSVSQGKSSGNSVMLKTDGFEWWAAGIGNIKSSLTYTTDKTTTQINRELQSYSNP